MFAVLFYTNFNSKLLTRKAQSSSHAHSLTCHTIIDKHSGIVPFTAKTIEWFSSDRINLILNYLSNGVSSWMAKKGLVNFQWRKSLKCQSKTCSKNVSVTVKQRIRMHSVAVFFRFNLKWLLATACYWKMFEIRRSLNREQQISVSRNLNHSPLNCSSFFVFN